MPPMRSSLVPCVAKWPLGHSEVYLRDWRATMAQLCPRTRVPRTRPLPEDLK